MRQLVYFEAVARCGGFTRAAEDLHIAQPAVSAQVRQLERELGATLLSRTTRRVVLTEAGELFLARARRVLTEIDAARDDVADLAAVLRGRVVLGATGLVGAYDLPEALAGFVRHFPHVSLSLHSGLLAHLVEELGEGTTDLVVGPLEKKVAATFDVAPLVSERLVLLAAPGRLPKSSPVVLAGLGHEPFVALPRGTGPRGALEAAVPGVRVPFEVSSASQVRALVAAGLGLALMPASAAHGSGPAVEALATRPDLPHPPFGLVWRDPLSPAASALRRHLVDGPS